MINFNQENWQEKFFDGKETEEEIKEYILKLSKGLQEEKDIRVKSGLVSNLSFELARKINKIPKPISENMKQFLKDIYVKYDEAYNDIVSTEKIKSLDDFHVREIKKWHLFLLKALGIQEQKKLN